MLGGYIWHTTGSGKTMTSFKSAQLIADSMDADKVVFLMDRIELGTQSLLAYQGFADGNQTVQATENTGILVSKLTSDDPANTLIVTSIQKMSRIKEDEGGMNAHDLKRMNSKRLFLLWMSVIVTHSVTCFRISRRFFGGDLFSASAVHRFMTRTCI